MDWMLACKGRFPMLKQEANLGGRVADLVQDSLNL